MSIAFRQVHFPLADYLQLGPSGTGKANLKKLRQGHMLGVLKFVFVFVFVLGTTRLEMPFNENCIFAITGGIEGHQY